jgi:hypothetical protein
MIAAEQHKRREGTRLIVLWLCWLLLALFLGAVGAVAF